MMFSFFQNDSHSLYNSRYRMVRAVTVLCDSIMLHSFTRVIFSYHLYHNAPVNVIVTIIV